MLLNVTKLQAMLAEVQAVLEHPIAWELKYGLVFSETCSRKVYRWFRELAVEFDYYDPDGSYEDDVRAFVSAFEHKMRDLGLA